MYRWCFSHFEFKFIPAVIIIKQLVLVIIQIRIFFGLRSLVTPFILLSSSFDIRICCKASKQLIAIVIHLCKCIPTALLFTIGPFSSTITFTIQCLKISELEFGSKHSNNILWKYLSITESGINHRCIVGDLAVLQIQSSRRSIRNHESCIKF